MADLNRIRRALDHTLLSPEATWTDLQEETRKACEKQVASICIPPYFVKEAKYIVSNQTAVCTVIGFPHGYQSWQVKAYEAKTAVNDGADELDMVVNLSKLKSGFVNDVLDEVNAVREVANKQILKVIIETGALSETEIITIVSRLSTTDIDYIKTSTGFNFPGANVESIKMIRQYKNNDRIKIKASGGIKTISDAEKYLDLGVDRLGASSLISLL